MSSLYWNLKTAKLGSLKPWSRNPKTSSKRDAKALLRSWDELGQFQTIAVSPDGDVYDGHQRLSALLAAYGSEYEVQVMVSSRNLTDEERRKIALYSRQIGAWNWDELANWSADELREWGGFDDEMRASLRRDIIALDNLAKSEQPESLDAEPQIDRADELRKKWGTESGQLWRLGEHRLICGDCTDPAVVERVMGGERAEMVFTDPPYGVAIGDKNKFLNSLDKQKGSHRVTSNLHGDNFCEDDLERLLSASFDAATEHCLPGAAWYVAAPGGPLHTIFGIVLKRRGIWRQTIQWIKNNSTFSPLGVCYHWQHEPVFFGWLPNGAHRWYGGRNQTTVWNIDRPQNSPEHPTMKPVELVERAISNSSQPGEIVLDQFCGSGTTIIACENLSRRCRAVEISPAYVAVALERWSSVTGKMPELLGGDIT